jgi:glycine cleavage system aminomethyltransferase T
VRRSPLHEHLKARGAVFGEVAGWERANWLRARARSANTAIRGSGRTGSTTSATSIMAVRTGVGLFDMTSFGKIRVEGRDALRSCSVSAPTTWTCAGRSSTPRC